MMTAIKQSDITNVWEHRENAFVHFDYQHISYVYFKWMKEVFVPGSSDYEDYDIIMNPYKHDQFDDVGIVGRWDEEKQLPVFKEGWVETSKRYVRLELLSEELQKKLMAEWPTDENGELL